MITIVIEYGDEINDGWKNFILFLLYLNNNSCLPASLNKFYDYDSKNGLTSAINEMKEMKYRNISGSIGGGSGGLWGSLTSYWSKPNEGLNDDIKAQIIESLSSLKVEKIFNQSIKYYDECLSDLLKVYILLL